MTRQSLKEELKTIADYLAANEVKLQVYSGGTFLSFRSNLCTVMISEESQGGWRVEQRLLTSRHTDTTTTLRNTHKETRFCSHYIDLVATEVKHIVEHKCDLDSNHESVDYPNA